VYAALLDQARRSHRGGANANRYSNADTPAKPRESAVTVGPPPAITNATPKRVVPAAAHHSRIRAAPPRRRASPASNHAAALSTTKNMPTTGHTANAGNGRSNSTTGTELASHAPAAAHNAHAGTRRKRLTNRNVRNGCANNNAENRPATSRGGCPINSRITASTNSNDTLAKTNITWRSSGSRLRA
jgi:hypothetical protein